MRFTTLWKLVVLFVCLVAVDSPFASASQDDDNLAVGKVALEKYKDCTSALQYFLAVSNEGRENPFWNYYVGQTYECLGKYALAIDHYATYDRKLPGQAKVADKLADLRYKLNKERADEEARKAEAARVAAAKKEEADRVAAAKKAEAERVAALRSNLSGSWKSSTGAIFNFKQGDDGVVEANGYLKGRMKRLKGRIINGHFMGEMDIKWPGETKNKCPYAYFPSVPFG